MTPAVVGTRATRAGRSGWTAADTVIWHLDRRNEKGPFDPSFQLTRRYYRRLREKANGTHLLPCRGGSRQRLEHSRPVRRDD
ncbi:hypothetical protein NDU88_001949 [Pleurodeles waltl]|uniref:Uncharacterized protein n=1 Tax=Pleurodeles waltl TaxID=8319 RepID=A0AAV7M0R8_PLEWA|nr:hypothetical protein NDU88_001949 [Pleurodeles waltl]